MINLPIKLAKDILDEYNLEQVIVLCKDKDGTDHMGTTNKPVKKQDCLEIG